MEHFAKKLAAGLVSVPSRLSWWPRHSRMIVRYISTGPEALNAAENVRQMASMSSSEWEAGIPAAARKGLMGHHTALEMALADAAKAGDVRTIERLGSLLAENAEEMAASFGRSIVEFPEGRFFRLLGEHVSSFTEIVRLKVEGSHKKAGERMEMNTVQLAAFTAEWF
jgi:hypothetical protein